MLGTWHPVAAQQPRDTLHMVFVGDINFARSLARNYRFTGRGSEVFANVRDRLRAAERFRAGRDSEHDDIVVAYILVDIAGRCSCRWASGGR